jgi:hypothetical protein
MERGKGREGGVKRGRLTWKGESLVGEKGKWERVEGETGKGEQKWLGR